MYCLFFFFNDTATTEIYTLSLHDALPISLLVEKGVLSSEEVRSHIEYMEARSPANGARLVARAWVDPEFKARLLSDTKAAARELGIDASGPVEFVVVENTPRVHNLIVCTLCSCYQIGRAHV